MTYFITFVLEFMSMIILFTSSVFFIVVFYKFFKGIKIPIFWIYFAGTFYLLAIQNAFVAYFPKVEPFLFFGQILKLIPNVLMLMGIYEMYKRLKQSI